MDFRNIMADSLMRVRRPLRPQQRERPDCGNVAGCGACDVCAKAPVMSDSAWNVVRASYRALDAYARGTDAYGYASALHKLSGLLGYDRDAEYWKGLINDR